MSCLAKSPSDRPQSVGEILKVLTSFEQRYTTQNTQIPLNIKNTEAELGQKTKVNLLAPVSNDEIAQAFSWPQDKPIANIVFPQPIRAHGELSAALWVMLPQEEIEKRLICTRYNQFLFMTTPHPIILWITLIYNRQHGAKWLPYYLDLKTSLGQEIARLLAKTGYYRVLFFAREEPTRCTHIQLSSVAFAQRQRLQQWVIMSNTVVSTADPQVSKNSLKVEYEKLKLQILAKLQAIDTDSPFDLSL